VALAHHRYARRRRQADVHSAPTSTFRSENGRITDATRIEAALPTIKWAGRPRARASSWLAPRPAEGKRDPKYSLQPVGDALAESAASQADPRPDCVGPEVERMSKASIA